MDRCRSPRFPFGRTVKPGFIPYGLLEGPGLRVGGDAELTRGLPLQVVMMEWRSLAILLAGRRG